MYTQAVLTTRLKVSRRLNVELRVCGRLEREADARGGEFVLEWIGWAQSRSTAESSCLATIKTTAGGKIA